MNNFLRKSICFVLLIFLQINVFAQEKKSEYYLSPNAEISLLTCQPGGNLYTYFGHSAIRVKDPIQHLDRVYNYGTFNFNTTDFYLKFFRGKLNYYLRAVPFVYFYREYKEENRGIIEQVFDLNQKQKKEIFSFLEWNRKPENKYYQYDFFFDNCATRIRDVFDSKLDKKIVLKLEDKDLIFRDIIRPYIKDDNWSYMLITFILATPADQVATPREYMLIPDYMKAAFDNATIDGKPFVKQEKVIIPNQEIIRKNSLLTPAKIFWLLFILFLFLTYIEFKNENYHKGLDAFLFFILGLLGMILFLGWVATEHSTLVFSWNMLWVIPSHFFLCFLLMKRKIPKWLGKYFLGSSILGIILLLTWTFIPQELHNSLIPLVCLASLRSYNIYRISKK